MNWLTLPDVADQLGVPITRVRQMVKENKILAVRRDGVLRVPAEFVHDGMVLKGLTGLLTVLRDAGYSDDEALEWLFREDATLPGTPVQALTENRGTEVKRRAQALAF
ncbi:MAG: Rv2175c family DNA-binding protein [Frankia sp.]